MAHKFKKGDDVHVFYRMSKRCSPERKYLATLNMKQGAYRPRTGISDGWVPARVEGVCAKGVIISYCWPHFFTNAGSMAECDSDWTEVYPFRDVRPSPKQQLYLCPPDLRPELTLITFRWGGKNAVVPPSQWGETGSSVSDLFIDSFVEGAVIPKLGNNFEVWTVYIEDQSDMNKIADSAHMIFSPAHPAMRSRNVCAMYHLYPTGFEENCIPTQETGSDNGAALVNQKALFRMIQAVERAGVPTRFPHPSGFYELLASKRWTAMMALTPHLRVPPTVAVPRSTIEQGCGLAARKALDALNACKRHQAILSNEPEPTPITKGVAKLGFSWEALDVKFWEQQRGLETALSQLTQTIEISQEETGQPHDLETIMVQEYCKHDMEVRQYVVEGKLASTIYTKFCKIKDNLEFGDFEEKFTQEEASRAWMDGDQAALAEGERQCSQISMHWIEWIRTQLCDLPPAIRFDYFVGRGSKPGEAFVWTLEICELGFSMLGDNTLPAKVFAAMLKSVLNQPLGEAMAMPIEDSCREEEKSPVAEAPSSPVQGKAGKAYGKGYPGGDAKACPPPPPPLEELDALGLGTRDPCIVPPNTLYVNVLSSCCTDSQIACHGRYNKNGLQANGFPVWTHDNGDRFLYFGNDGCWYVGDDEEKDSDFDTDAGYIRQHVPSGQRLYPHQLSGRWERGEEWVVDPDIWISADSLQHKSSGKKNKGRNA